VITGADILLENFRVRLDTGCNKRCFFCDSWHERPVNISDECIRVGLNEAKTNGAKRIAISGGEPLLSPCLESVLTSVYEVGLPSHITTNGTLLMEKASLLAKSGVSTIHFSVEMSGCKTRINGSEEMNETQIINAINVTRDVGINVKINHLVLRNLNWSAEGLKRILDFCLKNKVDLNLLDLLYTWNPSLRRFHVPYEEMREVIESELGVTEEIVKQSGWIAPQKLVQF